MTWLEQFLAVFEHPIVKTLKTLGSISSLIILIAFLMAWIFGIYPILKRLGIGRWKRKIGIFANDAGFEMLKNSLTDSGVFRECNIEKLIESEIEQAKTQSLIIVEWSEFGKHIEQIYDYRSAKTVPVIIFAAPGGINPDQMKDIANRPHTVVVNFRGRLLNDVLTSLMSS